MYSALISFIVLVSPAFAADGVVEMKVKRVTHPLNKGVLHAAKPHSDYLDRLTNQRFFYTSDVEIGTPPQKLSLLLDTGSSDTWVMGPGNQGSTFNPSNSKTWHPNNTQWEIEYGIGSAGGSWGTDTFKIGGSTLKSLSIGIATKVKQINQGIIGIGRKEAESTDKHGTTYDNLPFRMKAEGLIKSASYSLFLDDLNANSGTLLFGGVDHSKYSGQLVSMPFAHPRHLAVKLEGIYSDGRANQNNLNSPAVAVLDSGTSLSYVDSGTLTNIRTSLNANPSFAIGEKYYCDCNITENLIFDFGNTKVAVPAYNFLWPIETMVSGAVAELQFPQNSCYLGIEQSSPGENFMLLGDNVLRGMYIVYDLEGKQIAIAPSANKGGSNVEAIVGSHIPGAKALAEEHYAQEDL